MCRDIQSIAELFFASLINLYSFNVDYSVDIYKKHTYCFLKYFRLNLTNDLWLFLSPIYKM